MAFLSIVIPNYNGEKTIPFTLNSLEKQVFKEFEVIIVDDGSRDNSVSVIKSLISGKNNYALVELPHNRGAAAARNAGAKKANGEILMFIDADVIPKEDTVEKAANFFKAHSDADAVVGLPDSRSSFSNWASEHFNLRLHHNYIHLPEKIGHLYTSICAVKKAAFLSVNGFNEKMRSEEDPELGFRLSDGGFIIYSDKTLLVYHYKKISFWGLLKNDFKRSASRVKLILRRRMTESLIKSHKGFISTPMNQIYATLVMPFFWLSAVLSLLSPYFLVISLICLLFFLKFHYKYLSFLIDYRGSVFGFKTYGLLLIDMSVVSLGIAFGLLQYWRGEEY